MFIISLGMMGLIARFILQPLFYLLSIPTYAAIFMLEHFIAGIAPTSSVRNWCRLSIPKSFAKKLAVNAMASWMTVLGIGFLMAFSEQTIPSNDVGLWKTASSIANTNWGPVLIVTFWVSFAGLFHLNKKFTDDSSTPINKLQDLVIPDSVKSLFSRIWPVN